MRIFKIEWLAILVVFNLTSCSSPYATNDSLGYMKSHNGPRLVVDTPLTTANISYFYELPPVHADAFVDIGPPA